ncbi:MAG: Fis family transcriptional regulator [Flavipsychrobacter sp.]|jgi:two-component system KDP operon response regulator KdpE|nr:Fis family transcriptional regulator [Flavipsychrobacter sp.]
MTKGSILVIDDEAQMQKLLEITLQSNQFTVQQATTAKEGLALAASHPPDMILLDLGLPDEDGHSVLQQLREWYTNPVIILSVHNSETDIIRALDNGANDYLSKPFRTGELLARMRSALRSNIMQDNEPVLQFGNLEINLSDRIVKKNGEQVKLTSTEYSLLTLFARHEGKVLTHPYLLREIWGAGYINQSQYLRVFIAQLRKKIEDDPNRPLFIITESGVGYRFVGKE